MSLTTDSIYSVSFMREPDGEASLGLVSIMQRGDGPRVLTYLADPEWAALLRTAEVVSDDPDDPGYTYPDALAAAALPADRLSPFAIEGEPDEWEPTGAMYLMASAWADRVRDEGWDATRAAMSDGLGGAQ